MPRILKRLSLVFAVLALGLVLAAFITLRVLATRVIADDTEPVRAQLTADWAKNADALEAQLTASAAWNEPGAPTPPELGCQLRWTGESAAVKQHLARCAAAPEPIDPQILAAFDDLDEQLLVREADAPKLERDFGWMAQLQGHDDWRQVTGTPHEFIDPHEAATELPVLALRQVRGLALLRLLQGQRSAQLEGAVADVTALARALLNRPFVIDQLVGVAILDRTRALLDAAGHPELGVDEKTVTALRGSRLASAMLWHPWVPRAQRTRFLPQLSAASRCAAASEPLVVLELGTLLEEQYPEFTSDFAAWKGTAPCTSTFVTQALEARANMPEGSWKLLLPSTQFVARAEQGEFFPSLLVRVMESTKLGHKAVTELVLSVTTARPFSAPSEKQRP
jgi:hypothetical protein